MSRFSLLNYFIQLYVAKELIGILFLVAATLNARTAHTVDWGFTCILLFGLWGMQALTAERF